MENFRSEKYCECKILSDFLSDLTYAQTFKDLACPTQFQIWIWNLFTGGGTASVSVVIRVVETKFVELSCCRALSNLEFVSNLWNIISCCRACRTEFFVEFVEIFFCRTLSNWVFVEFVEHFFLSNFVEWSFCRICRTFLVVELCRT